MLTDGRTIELLSISLGRGCVTVKRDRMLKICSHGPQKWLVLMIYSLVSLSCFLFIKLGKIVEHLKMLHDATQRPLAACTKVVALGSKMTTLCRRSQLAPPAHHIISSGLTYGNFQLLELGKHIFEVMVLMLRFTYVCTYAHLLSVPINFLTSHKLHIKLILCNIRPTKNK